MRNNTLSLLSGRVKKTPSTSADSSRYSFLDLKNAEPDAGVPSAHSSLRGLFGSDTSGTRQWFYADAGLSVDTVTGQITVNEDTVAIDTAAFTNSTSDNLADVLFDLDQNLADLGDNTLTTVSTDDTIAGAGTSGSPLSIGQQLFFTGKPEFAGLAIHPNSSVVSGISLADPIVITTTGAHNLADGKLVTIEDVNGAVELNGNNYYVDVLTTSTFALYSDQSLSTSVDGSSGFTAYTSSGKILHGGYRFPEVDGTDGTYLKTNGYGLLEFDRPIQYGGSQPADPDLGDMWYDSVTTGDLLIWDGTNFSSATGGGSQGAFTLVQFLGDSSTTAFDTNNPSINKVLVFLNGILMRLTDDFTYSAGVVTFTQAPQTNDTIEVLLTGNAGLVGLDLLGIDNHDLITVDTSGNVTLAGNLDMNTHSIINVVDPVNAQDAATKAYVDSQIGNASLETAGDTGTGTVDLDTQSLTISGTSNEIETAASAQGITIGLPTTINVDVTGDITGNVTGNADTATALATGRNFSLTGAATATAVSFDGTGSVVLATSIANLPNSSLTNSSFDITDGVTSQTVDLGETITFSDGTDIDVVVSATNTLTVNHNVSGANSTIAATTNTFLDEITVTAQGHVTSVGTGVIDWNVADNYAYKTFTDGTNNSIADSNADTFTVSATDQIEAVISNDTLTLGHADSGVTAASYGSSTAIPVITIDNQGHITAASTSSISTTWSISDSVTTQNIAGGDTLIVADGTDINAVVSATDTLTINNTSTLDTVTGRGNSTSNDISVGNITSGNITTTGYLRGPATFTIDPATHGNNTGTVVIAGDLTVNGTTTTVNSNTVEIGDSIITLNSDEAGSPSQDAGIEIERGTSTNVQLLWNESNAEWRQTSDGTNFYKILSTADNYMEDVTAGTGISISHTPSAGSNATINTANIPNSSLTNSSFDITDGTTTESISLGDTLTFSDGTDINVVVSATGTLTVNHNVSGANSTITSAANTFLDEITVTAQGHVTSVGTGVIDWNVADNYAFKTISDGSNDAVADSNGDTFTVSATGDITASINPSNDTLSISFNNTSGYITAESDTLDSVTTRGNTTTNDITVGTVTYGGLNDGTTALTSTVAELNHLDGTTGITLANAGDLLIVGTDNTSIDSSDLLNIDTSNGRLGIGTSSPGNTLHLSSTSPQIRLEDTDAIGYSKISGSAANIYLQADEGNTAADSKIDFRVDGQQRMVITSSGNVGIGTSSPSAALNIVDPGLTTQFRISNTASNATTKYGAIVGSHYTNAEEPIAGMLLTSSSSITGGSVSIGGGITSANAVNAVKFYTAANNTTTSGTERMHIDSSGNVGIGTDAPSNRLDVEIQTTDGIQGSVLNSDPIADFANQGSNGAIRGLQIGAPTGSVTGPIYLKVTGTSNRFAIVDQSNSENFTILDNGNVGIGITDPQRKLTVGADSTSTLTAAAFYNADTTNGNGSVFSFRTDTSGVGARTFWEYAGVVGEVTEHDDALRSGTLRFFTLDYNGGGDRLIVTGDGKVGIGTDAPTELLHVKGNIVSEENGNGAGIYTFQKTVLANDGVNAVGDYTKDIFSIDNQNGAQVMTVMFNCSTSGYSVAKHYTVVHQFGQTPNSNLTVDTGPYSGHDFTVSFTNQAGIATGSKIKCTIENASTSINANITVTVFLGGSPTAATVATL